MKKSFFLFLFLFAGTLFSLAQNARLDSLINAEKAYPKNDEKRLNMLIEIMNGFFQVDWSKCFEYSNKSLLLASNLNDDRGRAIAYLRLGVYYMHFNNFDSSVYTTNKALELFTLLKDSVSIGKSFNNLGLPYENRSDYLNAKEYYIKAITIYEAIGRKDLLCNTYSLLGGVFVKLGDYRKAQIYLFKALENAIASGRKEKLAGIYMNLGMIYGSLNQISNNHSDLEKSREYFQLALSAGEQSTKNKIGELNILTDIALTYLNEELYEEALNYLLQALDGQEKQKDQFGQYSLAATYCNIAKALNGMCDTTFQRLEKLNYFSKFGPAGTNQYVIALSCLNKSLLLQKSIGTYDFRPACLGLMAESNSLLSNYEKAILFGREAYRLADSLNFLREKENDLMGLSDIYLKIGKYDSAYYYYKEYIVQRDSIDNKEVHDQLARKDAEYEYSIKEKDILHQKELSDISAANANTKLQQQLLLARTREQEMLLKDKALEIGKKDKEMQHLAYLKKMAELDVMKLEKQDKDKQLSLTKQNLTLQDMKLGKRELERNLLIVGVALSLLSIFLIFRNYRNQRKSNLKQKELNSRITWVNEELNHKNTKLAATLDDLKLTQAQLVETEKQKETEVIRRRISQDIHDDISSSLTRIAWLSELAREKAKNGSPADAESALEKILASSRETVDRLGEIIWAINPDRDNLEGFFAYLRSYIVRFFEDTKFAVTLDFPEQKPDLKFNPDLKRTLFLVVKEALHNIAKHSEAKNIGVAFHCPDHRYCITITDDGKGFDLVAMEQKSNGLRNMQKRMESVGGKIEIESQPQQGTVVSLEGEVYS
jgi:signal transduction histidine kinase/tetratricopeptide (TPR) repeat protein